MKTTRAFSLFAGALGLAALLCPVTPSHADQANAQACLDSLVSGAVAGGMRLRASDVHAAGPQEAVTYRVTLYKGLSYVLLGCADASGGEVDLDMRLYDSEGNLVSSDKSPDHQPFVDVSPPETGEYALQVLVYKTQAPKTDFALAIAYAF